ncbi:hypothetical protein [Sinorhizobium sp. P24N7]|uniref:hypothetical protein n=1 Tax=Sinorhizobium sp. P24N7 TaxID=3348358 RepID=UPI0036D25610
MWVQRVWAFNSAVETGQSATVDELVSRRHDGHSTDGVFSGKRRTFAHLASSTPDELLLFGL